ncbi:MAG: T9SS type B sorting domain-containing protein [Sphingobacteriales bacterium]|nr:MAG: T9SS type B sorting domain-containing protein [Sphingobacteriales bacterium]
MCHRKNFTHFLFCLGLLLTAFSAKASHIIGGEVRYEHMTGRLYRVILNLYGDCNTNPGSVYSQLATYHPPVKIYRDSTILYRTLTLDRTATPPQDVSPNCPSAITRCYSTSSSVPGIKRFEYSDTITLSNTPSFCWRFEYNDGAQARTGLIQNISGSSNTTPYLHSTLNNLNGVTNTSPTFGTTATPYFCQSPNQQFNPGASDSVADVLVYSLTDARNSTGSTVTYAAGYPAPYRLAATGTPSFNSQTGQLVFSPSVQQYSTVVYRVEEYRNGVRVGSILREMNFVVIPCTNSSPSANPSNPASGTTVQNNTTIVTCQGQTVSFNLNPTDPQNDTIDLTATGIPAGASYTITGNGTPTVTSNFTWNTTGVAPGTYNVFINYSDRACPISARQTVGYSIVIRSQQMAYTTVSNPTCVAKGAFQIAFPSGNPASVTIRQGATVVKTFTNPSGTVTDSLPAGTYTIQAVSPTNCTKDTTITLVAPTLPLLSATATPVSCFGGTNGTATATATGGNAPYTYSWNTGPAQTTATASNLSSGTYTATVTDASGCTATATATVTQPAAALTASTIKTDVLCNGGTTGTATVTAAGGTGTYTYSWNTTPVQTTATANNLTSGTYTVTVTDANSCTTTATAVINQPAVLAATAAQSPLSCAGGATGSIAATVSGGTTPYTYSWNTTPAQNTATASNLAAGTYTVTVTDAKNCTTTATATITPYTPLSLSTTTTNTSCSGATGTATVTATNGTGPYSYSWNTTPVQTTATAGSLASGTYTVTVTDAKNCTATATATVLQTNSSVTATTTKTDVSCNGGTNGTASVTAAGGTGTYTYSWNTTPVQTTATATNLTAGTYTATVTDGNGCTATASATVSQPTAITATATKTDVSCFGGANGTATATATGGTAPYTYSWNTTPAQTTATANNLTAGTYIVTVTDARNCTATATVPVNQPTALIAAATKTDVSCFGGTNGTATVTATGGTTPYTYSWNTTPAQTTAIANNLASGTYTVTVTDAKGCATTATATIAQPTVLAATAVKTDASCFGSTTGTATVTATGGTTPYTYSWNTTPVQTTATANNLASGTYTATVTDAKGCTTTASATVSQPTAITATATKTDVFCFGSTNGTATVSATGGTTPYTYSWNTTPIQTTASITGLTAGTYTATVTDAKGCTQTASATIAQPAAGLAITTAPTSVACFGGTNGAAVASVTGGTAPYTYSWNTTPAQTTATANNLPSGTYTVTVTDTKNCTATATAVVTQPTVLTVATTKTDVSCFGGTNGTATATATGGNGTYTFSWNTTPVQATATASNLSSGTYTVTVTDARGCTATATTTIGQPATTVAISTTKTDVACNGGTTGSATVTATGGTAPYTYSWNTTPVQTTATANNLASGTYTVTVTDAKGCSQTSAVTIAQPPVLAATTTASNVLCNGGSTGSINVTTTGGTAPYTYSWTTTPVQTTQNAGNLPSGTYTVTITDAKNCSLTRTVTITQPALLLNTVTKTDLRCFDSQDGTATATVSGGTAPYSYRWDNNPALTMDRPTGMSAGIHYVQVTDANSCTRTDTVTLTAPAPMSASLTVDSIPCFGQATGRILLSDVQGGTGPYSFLWEDGSGFQGTSHSGISSGTYTVRITDNLGCVQRFSQFLPEHPAMNVMLGKDTSICQGSSVTLLASGTADTWSWSPTTGLSCTDCPNPVATPQQTTSYVVTGTNAFGCQEKDTIRIAVTEHRPVAVGPTVEVCAGQSTSLTASGGDAYAWNPSATLQNATTASPVATPAATTTYQVVISQNSCFKDTLYQQVVVNANPTINAGKDLRLFSGAQLPLQVEASRNAQSIRWEPATNLSCADCWSPVLTALESTTYVATVTTASGCQQSDTIRIQVVCDESPFYVANTFTPNGDGLDDWFYPQGVGTAKITRFTITNRWGQVVFENNNITPNNPNAGWNGYFKGEPMDSGVFMYLMELICASGEKIILKGDINLIR